MIEYIIGFVSALIVIKIKDIVKEHMIKRSTKVYEVRSKEELEKVLKDIMNQTADEEHNERFK